MLSRAAKRLAARSAKVVESFSEFFFFFLLFDFQSRSDKKTHLNDDGGFF